MSKIPTELDPLSIGGILPSGYEHVESILKPAGAYWQTDIPTSTGFRMEADIVALNTKFYVLGDNLPPSDRRIYYFYGAQVEAGTVEFQPFRYTIKRTTSAVFSTNVRTKLVVEHADSYIKFSIDDKEFAKLSQQSLVKDGYFLFGAFKNSSGQVTSESSFRLYAFNVYKAETNIVVASYVPVRKFVNGVYAYGLYDTVAHKELPLVTGTIQP